jgi:rhodanese-related sulfurtransferase
MCSGGAAAGAHAPVCLSTDGRGVPGSIGWVATWPADTLFVVYCAGPHCNGTDKAAIRLASLGRKVKVMIGGMTGWADEGYAFEGEGVP